MALPITTIPPFNDIAQLPACAAACGHLYDANGACVPPAAPTNPASVYTACFCHDPRVAAFSTTTGGVCDNACTAEPDGFNSITNWFKSICDVQSTSSSSTISSSSSSSASKGSSGGSHKAVPDGPGGDWISNHWKWVIMLVILVVGIAGIWIAACFWRRRYIRKRDQKAAAANASGGAAREYAANASVRGLHSPAPQPGSSAPTLPNILLSTEKP